MSSASHSPWLFIPKPNPQASLKVICFPYAGGSVRSFSDWKDTLPDFVELIIIQMPARGARISEPPAQCMDELTDTLITELAPHLNCDFVFYGHSLGARVAFEAQRKMRLNGMTGPCHFVASGSPNPGKDRSHEKTHLLDDEAFKAKLKSLNGTPPAVLEHEELMTLFMPVLRADFKLANTYRYTGDEKSPCSLSVFAGKDDEITVEEQQDWQKYFSGEYTFTLFEGDHFFIDSSNQEVGEAFSEVVKQLYTERALTSA
ncbi:MULTISPECIES: thioesterase II family protein [Pseudoalteromonas]|uniref:Thioesterase domain-containing protein n=1 Tax=Pseudoalteromonas amylolytica TaxID=1859457 RepID=A0A1S1MX58_9GAMM|nr:MULTISPECIES: thioesterase domain-containing protein [Pseudoalteromonas]OHU85051.1 hypothetical protein BFC16_20440 [Pseudoalteromonas sp. JW3]OHU89997.1 hypothetical protein BET10_14535 [Pseudoalteromonas amylolytica]